MDETRKPDTLEVLDKCWARLDSLMDEFHDPESPIFESDEATHKAKGEATGVAWSIGQFYGRSVDWVRSEAVGRRNARIAEQEAKEGRRAHRD